MFVSLMMIWRQWILFFVRTVQFSSVVLRSKLDSVSVHAEGFLEAVLHANVTKNQR